MKEQDMAMILKTSAKSVIEHEVIKNLLSAQKRIAENGDTKEIIRISRYLLRLAQELDDVLIDVVTESNQ